MEKKIVDTLSRVVLSLLPKILMFHSGASMIVAIRIPKLNNSNLLLSLSFLFP